jgi:hypothetical protein
MTNPAHESPNKLCEYIGNSDTLQTIFKELQESGTLVSRDLNEVHSEAEAYKVLHRGIRQLRADISSRDKKLYDLSYCTCSLEGSLWTLAEQDYPVSKSRVIFYTDRGFHVIEAGADALKGEVLQDLPTISYDLTSQDKRVIISRLPSRWPGKVYVYTESDVITSQKSDYRVRITTQKVGPDGLRWSKTLHLEKLDVETKIQILLGRIKWLFILQGDSRKPTVSSDETKLSA